MAIEIVSFPIKNGGSFHSYVNVYQRVRLDNIQDTVFDIRKLPGEELLHGKLEGVLPMLEEECFHVGGSADAWCNKLVPRRCEGRGRRCFTMFHKRFPG
jgi:hypothetical protein